MHSATLSELSPDCLQYKLLEHCQDPKVEQPLIDGSSIEQIRIASRSERVQGRHPSPFDSWFEVDVFLQIVDRGYQVIPQYEVNPFDRAYRIDLVVVGVHGRLAVECDGDHWHGPDQFAYDMGRQRELERAGWTFWRVRGGAFGHDAEKAMESLWRTLNENQILPHSDHDCASAEESVAQESGNLDSESGGRSTQNSRKPSDSIRQIRTDDNDLPASKVQEAIVDVLQEKTHNSIATKDLTKTVCRKLGLSLRGKRREQFSGRINQNVGALKRKGVVKEYKSKNIRIKLLKS